MKGQGRDFGVTIRPRGQRQEREGNRNGRRTGSRETGEGGSNTQPYDGTSRLPQNRLYIPSGLEKELAHRAGANSADLDQYRWVVSSIVFLRFTDKRFVRDSFIPLNHIVLRSILSKRKVTRILADLHAWGFIESRRSWIPGSRSIGYRLKEPFRNLKIRSIPLTDPRMVKRLDQFRNRKAVLALQAGPGYAMVQRSLKELHIDRERAMRYIRHWYPMDSEEYKARLIGIDMIAHGNVFFTVDGKAGRAHHNLSNLAADLRPFLTLNGKPLAQVDISNSQPLFLHLTICRAGGAAPEEVERMSKLVSTGTFYDVLKREGQEREQFKKEVYQDLLFGRGTYTTPFTERFQRQFPRYAEGIALLKMPHYSNLAIALQAAEAEVIFKAVERFAEVTSYSAPILTIHDSLVTTQEFASVAETVLLETFEERHRIRPHLKKK